MTMYLLAVHGTSDQPNYSSPEEMQRAFEQVDAFNEDLRQSGSWVFAGGLEDPSIATVVSAHQGEVIVTDGPFGETKEHLGGFWVINVPDLDAALAWAVKGSAACMNPVEVRPFQGDTEGINPE